MRVVHHGDGFLRRVREAAGREVVGEAEGVAGLVCGELAGAGEDHGEHGIARRWQGFAVEVRREESFVDEVVLAAAERAEGDVALDDFSGAGIDDGSAVAPAAGVAMDPLDHVVADVHGVGVGGEDVNLEGSFSPAGGLEGLVPPACAFEQRGADGFGCAVVDVVLDGRDRFAVGLARWIFFDEAVADDELLVELFADGDVVVAVGGGEVAGTGVEAARGEAGAGEFDEGLVFADGEGVGVGGDVADELAAGGAVGGEGEDGFDLGVPGEGLGGVEGDGGAGGVELVGALLGAGEGSGYIVSVAEEEVGGVDEDGAVGVFGLDLEAVENGLGEGLADGELFGGVGGGGAEGAGWARRGGPWDRSAGSGRADRGRSGRGRGRGRWSRCRRGGSGCRGCRGYCRRRRGGGSRGRACRPWRPSRAGGSRRCASCSRFWWRWSG